MTCNDCIWCKKAKFTNIYYCKLGYNELKEIAPIGDKTTCKDFEHKEFPKKIEL